MTRHRKSHICLHRVWNIRCVGGIWDHTLVSLQHALLQLFHWFYCTARMQQYAKLDTYIHTYTHSQSYNAKSYIKTKQLCSTVYNMLWLIFTSRHFDRFGHFCHTRRTPRDLCVCWTYRWAVLAQWLNWQKPVWRKSTVGPENVSWPIYTVTLCPTDRQTYTNKLSDIVVMK